MERKKTSFKLQHRMLKKIFSIMLVLAMVVTLLPTNGMNTARAEEETNTLLVHFKNEKSWPTVNAKYGAGSGWAPITGYENAANNEFGVAISSDSLNTGWYTYSLNLPASVAEVQGLFNSGAWGSETQTANYEIPVLGDTEVWITYADASQGNTVTKSTSAPSGWKNTLRVHFKNEKSWAAVNGKYAAGDSWDAIPGYEDAKNNEYGVAIAADTDNADWYTYTIGVSNHTVVNGLFNNGAWGAGNQTSNYSIPVSCDTEVWVSYDNASSNDDVNVSKAAPQGWTGDLLVSVEPAGPSFDTAVMIMHFNDNGENWADVYANIAKGSAWDPIPGYEYAKTWPGAEVEADPANAGWYSFTISMPLAEFHCIFNNKDNGKQTGNINITPTEETTERWVTFTTNGGEPTITDTAPSGWTGSASNPPKEPELSYKSPVINEDGTVTFNLDATGTYKGNDSIWLMGEEALTGNAWTEGLVMEKDAGAGLFTYTTPSPMAPGTYEYKFRVPDSDTWFADPANKKYSGDNSKLVVPGLANGSMEAKKGDAIELPKLTLYDEAGGTSTPALTYTVKEADAASYVTIADGKLTVDPAYSGTALTLAADDGNGHTATVAVKLVDKIYTYNVYYFDHEESHMSLEATDVHVWEIGGGDIGNIEFTSLETLGDGKQWMKAVIKTSAVSIGLIPRSKGEWTWQTSNHLYRNTEKNENTDLYIVYGDNLTYTELPVIREARNRYVMVEYNRPDGDYEGWNVYTWNSGFGSEVSVGLTDIGGKKYAVIPVKDSTEDFTLEFCMRRSSEDDEWAEKDGGDHYVFVPADQIVVKAEFTQAAGITSTLAYNSGYEMKGSSSLISFYYRNDEALLSSGKADLDGTVKVVVNGTAYDMVYDAANARYVYDYSLVEQGNESEFYYYYLVNGIKVLDTFNNRTAEYGEEECSVFTYKRFEGLTVTASVRNAAMDYNDNNVLKIGFGGNGTLAKAEVKSVQADLSALGLKVCDVDTEIMELTISVTNTTKPGMKKIPVTVTDIYGNVYAAEAEVEVTARDKDGFDWDEAIIYFAVTDRFFDGNKANNTGEEYDPSGSLSYHGGDFAGLEAKLDYLEELGVNTVWITPIVENSNTTTTKDGQTIISTGYHGYWGSDFTTLNSHLGTKDEFASLIEAVHEHGMKLMVDVVLNHAGYDTEDYFNTIMVNEESGEYITMLRDEFTTVSGDNIYSSLSGLPDFLTENAQVRDQLIEWQTQWVEEYGIDYYRVDTVKHVDSTTWAAFKNELTKIDPDFKMIGEYSGAGYANTAGELGTGSMDSLLDFDFNDQAQNFVNGNLTDVEKFLKSRNESLNNTATLGAFLSSHDEDGLVYKLIEQNGYTEEQALNLFKVAATMQITAKGQAVVYYGEELGQYGADNYPYQTNRYDFDWEEAAAQAGDANSMLNHYKRLLAIRNDYMDVFTRGSRDTVEVSDKAGYDVVCRSYHGQHLYVGMNIKDTAKEVTIPVTALAGSTMVNLYDGKLYQVSADKTVTVTIPAAKDGGTVILAGSDIRYVIPVSEDFSEVETTVSAINDGSKVVVILEADKKVVPASVFAAMAGNDVVVSFIVDENAAWNIYGKKITTGELKDIDFAVTLAANRIPADKVAAIADGNNTLQLSLAHNGAFGFEAQLDLNVGEKYSSKYANLFYYNEGTGKLEYSQAAIVGKDGHVLFTFVHASDYVIVFHDKDMKPADNTSTNANTSPTPGAGTGDNAPIAIWLFAVLIGLGMAGYAGEKKLLER